MYCMYCIQPESTGQMVFVSFSFSCRLADGDDYVSFKCCTVLYLPHLAASFRPPTATRLDSTLVFVGSGRKYITVATIS